MKLCPALRTAGFALVAWYAAGCRPPAGTPAPPAADRDAGELLIYEMMTSNGTVASRTMRDSAGRIIRVVYYGARAVAGLRGPWAERDLFPLATDVRAYDAEGRLNREERYDSNGHLVGHTNFAPDGRRIWSRQLKDGVTVFEARYDSLGASIATELHFDRTGSYVVAIRGEAPGDTDLPHGWGAPANGLSCGVVLTAASGRADSVGVSINIRTPRSQSPIDLGELPEAHMSLIDARGMVISESRASERLPHALYASLHGTIGFLYPPTPLSERFPGLPSGRYTLRVELPLRGGITLRCNEVPVTIE